MAMRREPNFIYLLFGILLFLIIGPVTEEILGNADGVILMSAYSTMLIISLWSLQDARRVLAAGVTLAVTSVALIVLDLFIESGVLDVLAMLIYLMFQVLTIWLATEHLFAPGKITFNRVVGGTCIFFLLGMSWSILYSFSVWLDPNSFALPNIDDQGQLYWDMTYFSFVTLTTLGYGDILPIGAMAKALAYIEAVVGQIYVAVLIGALVSTYSGHRLRDK